MLNIAYKYNKMFSKSNKKDIQMENFQRSISFKKCFDNNIEAIIKKIYEVFLKLIFCFQMTLG